MKIKIKFDTPKYWERRLERYRDLHLKNTNKYFDKKIIEVSKCFEHGGECIDCSKEYKKIQDEPIKFYEPVCDCIPRCPHCMRILAWEFVSGKFYNDNYFCPYCGFLLRKNKINQYGVDFEIHQYSEYMKAYAQENFKNGKIPESWEI